MEQIGDEQFFDHGGVGIGFLERAAGQDRRHLTVFFNGVKPDNGYDFTGRASSGLRSHFLWIRDEWAGQATWYMCRGFDFRYEEAVHALIELRRSELGLSKEQCTLVGFSKGASAALYLGLKYGYKNIVASAPQTKVGSFARGVFPDIFRNMVGDHFADDGKAAYALNQLVPELLMSNDTSLEHNIYLFTSEADPQFKFHIKPYLNLLRRFDNFSVFITESDFVTGHFEVTHYNIPLIVSILGLLGDNVPPVFPAEVRNGGLAKPSDDTTAWGALRDRDGEDRTKELMS